MHGARAVLRRPEIVVNGAHGALIQIAGRLPALHYEGGHRMDREDFARKLSALRRGELRLEQESSISRYAALWPTDTKPP